MPRLTLGSLASQRVPVFASFDTGKDPGSAKIEVRMDGQELRVLEAPLLSPQRR